MGNSFQFNLEYQRTSDALTDPDQADQVQPVEPVGENTPGRVSIANLPWIIGGFGLALIVIALFAYWRSTQSSEAKPQQTPSPQTEGDQVMNRHIAMNAVHVPIPEIGFVAHVEAD